MSNRKKRVAALTCGLIVAPCAFGNAIRYRDAGDIASMLRSIAVFVIAAFVIALALTADAASSTPTGAQRHEG